MVSYHVDVTVISDTVIYAGLKEYYEQNAPDDEGHH